MSSLALYALRWRLATAVAASIQFVLSAGSAHADLVISTGATRNVYCDGAKCRAKAADAVLNVNQLQNMLSAENVTVTTAETAGPNIVVNAPLTWVSTNSLTLDAYTSVAVNAPITVAGPGGLSIITNDGGYEGQLFVAEGANVIFWGTANRLSINRNKYTLVNSIQTLAAAVKAQPTGFFALAKSYDAASDGTYAAAPVSFLQGTFEGLGNTIANLSINAHTGNQTGLIAETDERSLIENLKLTGVSVASRSGAAGGIVGTSYSTLFNDSISGTVTVSHKGGAGLLAGSVSDGIIANSHSSGTVRGLIAGGLIGSQAGVYVLNSSSTASVASPASADHAYIGGLAGLVEGAIEQSWSSGTVTAKGTSGTVGGLVGWLDGGAIIGSFSTGAVVAGDSAAAGGLAGESGGVNAPGEISWSYALGSVRAGANSIDGGLVGTCGSPLWNDFASGPVSGGEGSLAGGLVGWSVCGGMDQISASGNVAGGTATGGLVGLNINVVSNAYATGAVSGASNGDVGGLFGHNVGTVSDSYSTGAVTGNGAQYVGGLVGEDSQRQPANLSHTYWDLTTSGISNAAQGAGNVSNDAGITGRTEAQLTHKLPSGFRSTIWGQSPQINAGLPYLLGNNESVSGPMAKSRCAALAAKFGTLCRWRKRQ
jgi:hypothetical protein